MKYLKIYEEFVPEISKSQWTNSEWNKDEVPVQYRVTPNNIEEVGPNPNETKKEVFVFGSNLQGIHTKGAARFAIDNGIADEGQIEGPSRSGKAYAIPTESDRQKLSIAEIENHINKFFDYARANKDTKFLVTKLGTGYAGYQAQDIAPLFAEAESIANIYLPKEFWDVIL
jgi:hypothetical protein